MLSDNEISALIASASPWEMAGYVFAALVALGCAGEALHEFVPTTKFSWWNNNGGKASALLLIAALAFEIPVKFTTNNINAAIVANLSMQTAEARTAEARLKESLSRQAVASQQKPKQYSALSTERGLNCMTFARNAHLR